MVCTARAPAGNSSFAPAPSLCFCDTHTPFLTLFPPLCWDISAYFMGSFCLLHGLHLKASWPPPSSLRMTSTPAPSSHIPPLSSKAKYPADGWTVPPCYLTGTSDKTFPQMETNLLFPQPFIPCPLFYWMALVTHPYSVTQFKICHFHFPPPSSPHSIIVMPLYFLSTDNLIWDVLNHLPHDCHNHLMQSSWFNHGLFQYMLWPKGSFWYTDMTMLTYCFKPLHLTHGPPCLNLERFTRQY